MSEQTEPHNITLYPQQVEKVKAYMKAVPYLRTFASAVQYIIDQANTPEPTKEQPAPRKHQTQPRG